MTDNETWRESLKGGSLNMLSPSIVLLVAVLGENFGISGILSTIIIIMVWFGGFFILIRVQFGRRHRNADVFKAFWRTTFLGFSLLAVLLAAMYFVG